MCAYAFNVYFIYVMHKYTEYIQCVPMHLNYTSRNQYTSIHNTFNVYLYIQCILNTCNAQVHTIHSMCAYTFNAYVYIPSPKLYPAEKVRPNKQMSPIRIDMIIRDPTSKCSL